ncbi:MAG: hypothetical protein B6D64_00585 [Bacteroidetes bacterium 4484_276]|nr:MAG: hypothetical protein B6D64_00585 [Bacteroidetes bacterium 4484_276]
MGTITIESKETDILYIIDELAKRLRLKSKIKADKEDIPQGIVDGIKSGLKDVEEILAGKQKRQTLKEMFDEC